MTTKAELEQEVQDNWEAFLDMQTQYHQNRGALVQIDNILCGVGSPELRLELIGYVIEEMFP